MHPEVVEYQEFAEEIRQQLENTYQYCMMMGDKIGAHEAVKSLMEYRLIEKDDPRVSVKTKLFSGANGVDVKKRENWGRFDYRRGEEISFLPRYLFGNIRSYETINCSTFEHWSKRVEGNYEGDIKIPESFVKLKIDYCYSPIGARGCLEDIARYYKMNGATFPKFEETMELVNTGVIRMFRIEVMGNILSKYRTFGYAMMKMDDSGRYVFRTFLKYEAAYNSWVNVEDFIHKVEVALGNMIDGETVVHHVVSPRKALERQKTMLENNRLKDLDNAEQLRKHHEAMKAKEAEKEAKKKAKGSKA